MYMKDNVKCHTANYFDTFIEVAEDCPATIAALPPAKAPISVVRAQFEMIINNPYRYSSDDVLFETIGRPKKSAVPSSFVSGETIWLGHPSQQQWESCSLRR